MTRLLYNGLTAALAGSGLTSGATSVTFDAALTHSGGTAVPTLSGGDYIPLSLLDASGHLSEIVFLTAYTSGGTTGTITRGAEGTTGSAHAVGTPVVHALTKYDIGVNDLDVGEIVPRRTAINSGVVVASGVLYLAYFTADKSETIATLTAATSTVAAAATPTLCRMGLYSVSSTGDLTLVASTPNDTTLFAATSTSYAKALSVPYAKVAGQRYAVGMIVVSSAAMPTFAGSQMTATNWMNVLVRLNPAIAGRLLGQTDLPATVLVASLVGFQAIIATRLS